VPIESIPGGSPDSNEVNERLSVGLKTCRSVVANYKALLSPEQDAAEPSGKVANDDGGASAASGEELS
jgi:hypothetical protein